MCQVQNMESESILQNDVEILPSDRYNYSPVYVLRFTLNRLYLSDYSESCPHILRIVSTVCVLNVIVN